MNHNIGKNNSANKNTPANTERLMIFTTCSHEKVLRAPYLIIDKDFFKKGSIARVLSPMIKQMALLSKEL